MKIPRRMFLQLAAGAAAVPAATRIARAQTFPARPVHWIVPYPPGGPTDIVARLMAQWLSERLGQPFVIDNRPGAAGNIGTEMVVRAPADGYMLLFVSTANAINTPLYDNISFNFIRDIAPVASIVRVPLVMEVNPAFPANTVMEFIAYAKANPGKIDFASPGVGTSIHVAAELFRMMARVDLLHVPYRGSAPALVDLIGRQVQVMFDAMPSSIEYIRGGKLRALAVTTAERSWALPDVPTISETVPGYEASVWFGIGVPKQTPREIVEKLNAAVNAGLIDTTLKARLADLGGATLIDTPADFGKLIADETEKWTKVIKFSAAKRE
jgi:tripartite-type tricarboxylate transporter receptor subunit TctC